MSIVTMLLALLAMQLTPAQEAEFGAASRAWAECTKAYVDANLAQPATVTNEAIMDGALGACSREETQVRTVAASIIGEDTVDTLMERLRATTRDAMGQYLTQRRPPAAAS